MNEAALKARLKFIAQERLKTFNEVWKQLLLERFLARLSGSPYREQFIFKGGLLLAQYMALGRETTDIDLQILSQPHMEYTGCRATLQAYFGNMARCYGTCVLGPPQKLQTT